MFGRNKHTPIWFLDIVGVLAPTDRRQPGLTPVQVGQPVGSVLVSPSIIARINHLAATRACEVQCLTSWAPETISAFAPKAGLRKVKVAPGPERATKAAGTRWKHTLVREAAVSGRRFVWTDPEVAAHDACADVAGSYPGQGLTIAPAPEVGLTHDDIDQIESFLLT